MSARKRTGRFFDLPLLLLCLAASAIGIALIYSATRYNPALHNTPLKQAAALLLGVPLYLLFSLADWEALTRRLRPLLFAANLLLLGALFLWGNEDGTGNRSWLLLPGTPFNLQPAELVKFSFLLLLCLQLAPAEDAPPCPPCTVLLSAAHCLLLCALLYAASGDLGMVLLYLCLYFFTAVTAGMPWGWLLGGLSAAAAALFALWPRLPDYVRLRFLVVLHHDLDPLGRGFQQGRSLLTLGSGGLWGQGYLQGIQSQSAASHSLPARHTDFIFSAACEEWGFFGALLLLGLLSAILLRCIRLGSRAPTAFRRCLCCGVGAVLAVQTLLNVGMCLYIAPVIGLTLPFFSYGGSSLLSLWAGMGLVSGAAHAKNAGHSAAARV